MGRIRFKSGQKLADFDPNHTDHYEKQYAESAMKDLNEQLDELQEMLFAEKKHAVLFIIQGMDCSGKDGVVKKALNILHPQGFQAVGFKAPTEEELAHDYLWRAHKSIPAKGNITAFIRSYYEDVLVTRVQGSINDKEVHTRFKQINDFEKLLTKNGVMIVKVFLHISKEFQREKLLDRLDNPKKQWKFDANDLVARKEWKQFVSAYEDVFEHCSKVAPWYIIPADNRWYRDWLFLQIAVDSLKKLKMNYPEVELDIKSLRKDLED
jgi:PPK2 family polyphosphate:nucleotide phosphotransferase